MATCSNNWCPIQCSMPPVCAVSTMTLVSHIERTDPATSTEAGRITRLRPVSPWQPMVLFWLLVLAMIPVTVLAMMALVTWLTLR